MSCTNLSKDERDVVGKEIENLLSKGVISVCDHKPGEVLSPVFTRGEKDGTQQMILNLKYFNSQVTYHHFKMETLHTALSLIRKNFHGFHRLEGRILFCAHPPRSSQTAQICLGK